MFRKYIALPSAITLASFVAAFLSYWYFWNSGWYTGEVTVVKRDLDIDILSVFVIFIVCIFLKYLLYSIAGQNIMKIGQSMVVSMAFYCFYALAITVDFSGIVASSRPVTDSGFAALVIIIYSPPILLVGLVIVTILATVTRFFDGSSQSSH